MNLLKRAYSPRAPNIKIDNLNLGKVIAGVVIGILLLSLFTAGIKTVDSGNRGVLTTFGAVEDKILPEGGPYFIIPFVQDVVQLNVQTLKIATTASAASQDLQIVSAIVTVNYHVDAGQVNKVYQTLRFDYADRVISPAIQESVKAGTAKFTAEQLITKRPEVKQVITDDLTNRLMLYGIIVESVLIESFDFSEGFNQAIEAKVTAEQQALEAERILDRKRIEAEQRIAEAYGVSESIKLTASANADATLLEATARAEALRLQRQEVSALLNQYKAIEKWDGVLPQFTGGETIPFIDITGLIKE